MVVHELGSQHLRACIERFHCRQVVVLAGVYDDPGIGVYHPREVLIHESALHVDVPEQDAVHGIIEHHIQPLHGAHVGDLGHTQP